MSALTAQKVWPLMRDVTMTGLPDTNQVPGDTEGVEVLARMRRGGRVQATMRDRLQPALLDRLVDDAPTQRTESSEAAMISRHQLRAAVLRDLRWLLNTVNLESTHTIDRLAHVRSSALNFGVRAMAGQRMSEIDWSDVEDAIREAIIHFEPRILPASVEVACIAMADALEHYNVLSLEIRGMLWCVPYSQPFLFRTDIDLESGHMDLHDAQGVQVGMRDSAPTARIALAPAEAPR